MRLNLNHLAALRELDRLGTLSAVARSLSYTSGALSQQMDALERAVGDRPMVRGDRYEIQQVLLNLLTNAVHALSGLPATTAAPLARLSRMGQSGRSSPWQHCTRFCSEAFIASSASVSETIWSPIVPGGSFGITLYMCVTASMPQLT